MARVTLDDGKVYSIVICDKDFARLIAKGADALACEVEQIIDQDDFLTIAETAKLEHKHDVLTDLMHAMDMCAYDRCKSHCIDGRESGSWRAVKDRIHRPDPLDGDDDA